MATSRPAGAIHLLIINPNSSRDMTNGMEQAIKTMGLPPVRVGDLRKGSSLMHYNQSVDISTYTGPNESPSSINNGTDIERSTKAVLEDLETKGIMSSYDGVLIACYSVHSLVDDLEQTHPQRGPIITGIFEASILTALSIIPANTAGSKTDRKWGIVTTGKFWEKHLEIGVKQFLGSAGDFNNAKFAGVESTGLNAGDFHHVDHAEVMAKLKEATLRLLDAGSVMCVVMGCAGMAGLEKIIREAAVTRYGQEMGGEVAIVDGVKAGILQLELMVKARKLFAP
jgi:Asp/Glu/hydantoin racemase